MSNQSLNFKIQEIDDKPFVIFDMPGQMRSSGRQVKTLALKDFISFCKTFEDSQLIDTGYLPKNMVRKLNNSGRFEYLFFYDSIPSNFTFSLSPENKAVMEGIFTEKDSLFRMEEAYDQEYRENRYVAIMNKPLEIKNVLYYVMYDKNSGNIYGENILFVKDVNLLNKVTVNDDIKVFKSIFPNHYNDRVCWGTTGYSHNDIISNLNENNIDYLNTGIASYFNSNFNRDLMYNTEIGNWTNSIPKLFIEGFLIWLEDYFTPDKILRIKDKLQMRSNGNYCLDEDSSYHYPIHMLLASCAGNRPDLRQLLFANREAKKIKEYLQLLG